MSDTAGLLPEEHEYAIDLFLASSDADLRAAKRGIPLADFEDRDGYLPDEREEAAD